MVSRGSFALNETNSYSYFSLNDTLVRLGFHDCVGGCDGCVDLRNADNNGLSVPIDALDPIVEKHEDKQLGFTRADIWALAALVGADVAQPFPVADFSLETIGRQNCEDANTSCTNDQGTSVPCRQDRGPHRHLPHADITTADLFHFFSDEFSFNVKETVALFGAHTLGVLTRENSEFDGQDGWVVDQTRLDNNYYFELVGNVDPDIDFADQVDDAPPWFRDFEDNSDLPGIPDRNVWVAFPEGQDGQRILMLNADVSENFLSFFYGIIHNKYSMVVLFVLAGCTCPRINGRKYGQKWKSLLWFHWRREMSTRCWVAGFRGRISPRQQPVA